MSEEKGEASASEDKPKKRKTSPKPKSATPRKKKAAPAESAAEPLAESAPESLEDAAAESPVENAAPKPRAKSRSKASAKSSGEDDAAPASVPSERLHKFLASTGAGSRRECETFIATGRVAVNGAVVTKMGVKIDPDRDVVTLDGERMKREDRVYYLCHKPVGYICTSHDERGRPRVIDLVRDQRHRVYTVGRLDAESTGLILLTNDGAIANVVCHPRYRIEKVYQVVVRGDVTREQVARVEAGVWLAEGRSSPAKVRPLGRNPRRNETVLEMTVFEGRNREVRRVFAKAGLTVRRLQRSRIGPLELGETPSGAFRPLQQNELTFVKEAEALYLANREAWDAELPPEPKRARPVPRGPRRYGQGGGGRPQGRRPFGPPRGGGGGRFGGPREGAAQGGGERRFDRPRPQGGYGAPRGGGDDRGGGGYRGGGGGGGGYRGGGGGGGGGGYRGGGGGGGYRGGGGGGGYRGGGGGGGGYRGGGGGGYGGGPPRPGGDRFGDRGPGDRGPGDRGPGEGGGGWRPRPDRP